MEGVVTVLVDIIVLYQDESKSYQVLLMKRTKPPFEHCWGFISGRIKQKDKDIIGAAYRKLGELTHIDNLELKHISTIGNNFRDPDSGFTLSNIFFGITSTKQLIEGCNWFCLDTLPEMAFDHKKLLFDFIERIK